VGRGPRRASPRRARGPRVDHAAQHRGPEDRVAVGQAEHLPEARVGDDAVGREVPVEDAEPGRRDRQPEPLLARRDLRLRVDPLRDVSAWCSTARTAPSSPRTGVLSASQYRASEAPSGRCRSSRWRAMRWGAPVRTTASSEARRRARPLFAGDSWPSARPPVVSSVAGCASGNASASGRPISSWWGRPAVARSASLAARSVKCGGSAANTAVRPGSAATTACRPMCVGSAAAPFWPAFSSGRCVAGAAAWSLTRAPRSAVPTVHAPAPRAARAQVGRLVATAAVTSAARRSSCPAASRAPRPLAAGPRHVDRRRVQPRRDRQGTRPTPQPAHRGHQFRERGETVAKDRRRARVAGAPPVQRAHVRPDGAGDVVVAQPEFRVRALHHGDVLAGARVGWRESVGTGWHVVRGGRRRRVSCKATRTEVASASSVLVRRRPCTAAQTATPHARVVGLGYGRGAAGRRPPTPHLQGSGEASDPRNASAPYWLPWSEW
jgi:hypothetical protein